MVEDAVKEAVDMLCAVISSESLGTDTMIATNDHENTEEPTFSDSKNSIENSSSVSDEDDDNWTARHYRMGIAAFLKQDSRSESVFSRKRSVGVASEKGIGNISSNFKEVFRERKLFVTKAADYGFSMTDSCNNYIKSCKWSSSGSYLATASQDRIARIFHFDPEHLEVDILSLVTVLLALLYTDIICYVKLKSSMGMGDLIYDSCWHPTSDWLVTSSKDHPIHVWDSNGRWLATFRGINSLDELDNAHSLCFTFDGSYLYAGYKSSIRKFDMNRPGHQVSELTTWNKESKGQKGIISCIAVCPMLPTNYAAGSYGKTVGFYSDYSPSVECMFECPLAVTLLRYTPNGNFLLTAGRKDSDIICWDLRYPGKIYSLYSRPSATSQRIYFDIDRLLLTVGSQKGGESSGTYLFSGSSNGELYVFDLKCTNGDEPVTPCVQLSAHSSALCGVSIHKERPIVATCSGQRVFPFPELDQVDDIDPGGTYEDINSPELLDNSLALWSFDR
uniref:WD repeat-containing protein 79 n=1 Tax=Elaeophora elaphi TaxID=1147741 RepID=A0A0R3RVE7_9BILA